MTIPEESTDQVPEQNTYPGRDEERANTAYNLQDVRGLKNNLKSAKNITKTAGKMAKTGKNAVNTIRTAQKLRQAYAAAQIAYTVIGSVVSLKIIIIITAIIILILVLQTIFNFVSNSSSAQLTSSGPVKAKIGDRLDYVITVNYPSAARDIIITDQIPQGTEYVNAPRATYDPATNTVSWNMAAITGYASGSPSANINTTLSLTLLATKDNSYIINVPKATIFNEVLGESDSLVTPTLFQITPAEAPDESGYPSSNKLITPTLFQKTASNMQPSPAYEDVISNCVVTKIGDPVISPSLPPQCSGF